MSLISEYYSRQYNELPLEKRVVFLILRDITDRDGLENAWEEFDEDIQNEILEEWINIVKKEVK